VEQQILDFVRHVYQVIVLVWILTFPICGLLGWLIVSLLKIAA